MTKGLYNRRAFDRTEAVELILELNSFAGGENIIGADHELKNNESRVMKNWFPVSLGKMIREKGFVEVADGGVTYTDQLDFLAQHYEGASTEIYGIIEGDLVIKSSSNINQEDAAAFTSGVLTGGVSAGDKLWMTNSTDNLKYKTIGNAIATPSDTPPNARDRISFHKFRLVAEGGGTTVYGSKAGSATWTDADAWSKAGDAWSIDLPDLTQGHIVDWPSGSEIAVFTKFGAYTLFSFPSVAYRLVPNSYGCSAPDSVAGGNEGVLFISEFPTKGVILWDGVNFINTTEFHDFIDNVDLTKRIFATYKDQEYHLFYTDTDTADAFPNRWRIYSLKYGAWREREVNPALSDNFGYPALLTKSANAFYVGSSQKDKMYELLTTDTDDDGNDTQANYKTKNFTSSEFSVGTGGKLGIDGVTLKLVGVSVTFKGTVGTLSISWTADNGRLTGSQTIDMTSSGDLLNSSFMMNSSLLVATPPSRTVYKSFGNNAVGRVFNFQVLNNGSSSRPEIEKIRIHAIPMESI